jgi:hypothetical protein
MSDRHIAVAVAVAVLFTVFSSEFGLADDMRLIEGKWSSDVTGEPVWFKRAFPNGWDALISWSGQNSIVPSSYQGSHIKTDGQLGSCYYYINLNGPDMMTWALRAGGPKCPPTSVFHRVML